MKNIINPAGWLFINNMNKAPNTCPAQRPLMNGGDCYSPWHLGGSHWLSGAWMQEHASKGFIEETGYKRQVRSGQIAVIKEGDTLYRRAKWAEGKNQSLPIAAQASERTIATETVTEGRGLERVGRAGRGPGGCMGISGSAWPDGCFAWPAHSAQHLPLVPLPAHPLFLIGRGWPSVA